MGGKRDENSMSPNGRSVSVTSSGVDAQHLERVFPPEVKVNPRTVGGVYPIDKLPDAGGAPRNVKGKVGS